MIAGKSDAVLVQTVVSHLSDVNALVFIDDSQVRPYMFESKNPKMILLNSFALSTLEKNCLSIQKSS